MDFALAIIGFICIIGLLISLTEGNVRGTVASSAFIVLAIAVMITSLNTELETKCIRSVYTNSYSNTWYEKPVRVDTWETKSKCKLFVLRNSYEYIVDSDYVYTPGDSVRVDIRVKE